MTVPELLGQKMQLLGELKISFTKSHLLIHSFFFLAEPLEEADERAKGDAEQGGARRLLQLPWRQRIGK